MALVVPARIRSAEIRSAGIGRAPGRARGQKFSPKEAREALTYNVIRIVGQI
jgi:hypothetical protein